MKKKIIIYGSIFAVLLIIGAIILFYPTPEEEIIIPSVDSKGNYQEIIVYIQGEVKRPGIYIVDESYRINDCLILAGGCTADADLTNLNLAGKVTDGMQIVVTRKSGETQNEQSKISLNKASLEQLIEVPGIGSAIAQNIIDYRTQNGGFSSLEQLKEVSRISETLYNKIKDYFTL